MYVWMSQPVFLVLFFKKPRLSLFSGNRELRCHSNVLCCNTWFCSLLSHICDNERSQAEAALRAEVQLTVSSSVFKKGASRPTRRRSRSTAELMHAWSVCSYPDFAFLFLCEMLRQVFWTRIKGALTFAYARERLQQEFSWRKTANIHSEALMQAHYRGSDVFIL